MYRIRATTAAVLLILLSVVPAAARADPFTGAWSATDVDGSAMLMSISSGPTGAYQVVLIDRVGTICLNNDAASDLFQGSAVGTVSGDVLAATWLKARCGNIRFDFEDGQFFMEYLPDSDQLFGMDVYWHRPGS
ncbi:MAG TPA: hypothetical protein VLA59_00515 [Patescibacteria group bacterium]|nr:hypothetical protein [Patescibacteria group bacterium]